MPSLYCLSWTLVYRPVLMLSCIVDLPPLSRLLPLIMFSSCFSLLIILFLCLFSHMLFFHFLLLILLFCHYFLLILNYYLLCFSLSCFRSGAHLPDFLCVSFSLFVPCVSSSCPPSRTSCSLPCSSRLPSIPLIRSFLSFLLFSFMIFLCP
jgi:hypothetical protein